MVLVYLSCRVRTSLLEKCTCLIYWYVFICLQEGKESNEEKLKDSGCKFMIFNTFDILLIKLFMDLNFNSCEMDEWSIEEKLNKNSALGACAYLYDYNQMEMWNCK